MSEAPPRGRLPRGMRREVVSFTRRDGRLHPRIAKAWSPVHEAYLVQPERTEREASVAPGWVLDQRAVFGRMAPLVVEIGSGTGEALLASAAAHPGVDHLGVEVYRPGAALTVIRAEREGLRNVRVIEADAAALLRTGLAADSVTEVRVFFPDPWPKAKHHKRRLVTTAMLDDVARVLQPGGVLRLATDWQDYGDQMLAAARACSGLENPHQDWAPRFEGRPVTRFERKGTAAGRVVRDLELVAR